MLTRHSGGPPGKRVQLHRAISKLGWGSRGEGQAWIAAGRVSVDGRVCRDPFTWVDLETTRISLDQMAPPPAAERLISIHKPLGVVVTRRDERGKQDVFSLIPNSYPRLIAVGRLDADSEGLLLLTTSGVLANALTDPEHHVPKRYMLTVRGRVEQGAIAALRNGIDLKDGPTRPAEARLIEICGDNSRVELVLTEGRNRQARRMLAAVGHPVERLIRTSIGDLELGDLKAGSLREEPFDRFENWIRQTGQR